jgi:hypothetical protein
MQKRLWRIDAMTDPQQQNQEPPAGMTDRQTYNVVTDTVMGPNVRLKDNVVQGIAILVCLLLGTGIGAAVVEERVPGALVGGFLGLLAGLFGSGLFLMIYRFVMHVRGRHD